MDDIPFDQTFGAPAPKTASEEAWHAEQERKKYDIIRVKNPTAEDFYVMYDVNRYQKVPAQSHIDVPRYIAIRYMTHMKDKLINAMAQAKHDEYMAERRAKGQPEFASKYDENQATYAAANYPKTDDPRLMAEVMDELWVGLVHEFGRDVPPQTMDSRQGEVDLTPPEMKIMEGLDRRRAPAREQSVPPQSFVPYASQPPQTPFTGLNQRLSAEEVTNE